MSAIVATGSALPSRIVTSHAIEDKQGLPRGTIQQALGVEARRVAPASMAASDLAVQAIEAMDIAREKVELLLLATSTPDHVTPATAPLVAHRLGLTCAATDVTNTCSGWLYALALADRFRGEGLAIVAAANILSRRVDWQGPWQTAALFGDGAGAVALGPAENGAGILGVSLSSDGGKYAKITVPAGGSRTPLTPARVEAREHLLRFDSPRLSDSVDMLVRTANDALGKADLDWADIDHYIPHQASARLIHETAGQLGLGDRTRSNLREVGNTSSASIPLLLDRLVRDGTVKPGHTALLSVVAGGMAAGSVVVRF